MRVVLLPSAYAPAVGGVEELTHRLAVRLVERGHAVEVWTIRHPAELPSAERLKGIPVRRFPCPLPAANAAALAAFPWGSVGALRLLSKAVADFHPDVLHVQCFSAQGIYATALAARHRLPFVVSLQGETVMDDHDIYGRSVVMRLGLRTALRRAAGVTGCSRFVLDDAEHRFGLPAGRGAVIHNGVEIAGECEPLPLVLPFPRFVLALGRVVEKKGFDLLLEAFAKVAPQHPDVGLVVAGSGPAHQALARQVAHLGLKGQVSLPGRLDRGGVAWAMQHAEVFVLPSRVEPFGIVVLEAMRAGRPVIVSAHGGAPEIVGHDRDGLVIDPFDAEALSAGLLSLLGDPSLAGRLAAAGRRRVEEFAWDRIVDQYERLYRNAG